MTGIFYGSTTGNTQSLAADIAGQLGVASPDVYDVASADAAAVAKYDCLLLGCSTWGAGDLQDDWYGFIKQLKAVDLSGKKVGLFGCGDSASYPDTFCDAVGVIRQELAATGCAFIGEMDENEYPVTDSLAFGEGKAYGLLVDDDEPAATDKRLEIWLQSIRHG